MSLGKNVLFFFGLFVSALVFADDRVVLRSDRTEVRQSDVVRAVSSIVRPEQLTAFFADEKKVRDTIARLFVQRKLAEEAGQRVLTFEERSLVEEARLRALTQVQIEYLIAGRPEQNFEAVARETYIANPKTYTKPPQVRVEHILVSTKSRSDAEARSRAELVRAEVLEGKPFDQLAREYSDDPSVSKNGGDMGFFPRGTMVKPFEDVAFSMNAQGEVSEPVKTDFGYHVIRFIDRKPEASVPFEQVKDGLIREERAKFRNRVLNEEYNRISSIGDVKVDQEAILELITQFEKLPRQK